MIHRLFTRGASITAGPLMYWPPWAVTHPWGFKAFRGCDEHHNKSWALGLPFLGCFIVFKMEYDRAGLEHFWAVQNGEIVGPVIEGCQICDEIVGHLIDEGGLPADPPRVPRPT